MNGNRPPDRQLLTRTEGEGETLDMPEGMGRDGGIAGRTRNEELGIRNSARPALADFGFANFEFRISGRTARADARCWMLDAGSAHPPGSRDGCPAIRPDTSRGPCGARVPRAGRAGGVGHWEGGHPTAQYSVTSREDVRRPSREIPSYRRVLAIRPISCFRGSLDSRPNVHGRFDMTLRSLGMTGNGGPWPTSGLCASEDRKFSEPRSGDRYLAWGVSPRNWVNRNRKPQRGDRCVAYD